MNEYNAVNVKDIKIKNNLIGVDYLLKKISNEQNCDKYFSFFILYVLNLQRWLYNLKEEITKKKEK